MPAAADLDSAVCIAAFLSANALSSFAKYSFYVINTNAIAYNCC